MELEKRYFTVLDALPEHVFVFSESGIYIDVYGGADNQTGFDCKAFIGRSLYDVAPIEIAKEFHFYIKEALEKNATQISLYKFDNQTIAELPIVEEMWFEGVIKPLPLIENGERTVMWRAKNVTQRHLLETRLKTLSEIDDLTGINNRRSFTHVLSKTFENFQASNHSASVLILDIDRFKNINDMFGHSYGDRAIQYVVDTLKLELQDDYCFGRIGGEEFALLLSDTDLDDAMIIAERLRASLEKNTLQIDSCEIDLTISIGVTQFINSDENIKDILSRADKAMYYSKHTGRNKVSKYSSDMDSLSF